MENAKRKSNSGPYLIVIGLLVLALIGCIIVMVGKDSGAPAVAVAPVTPATPASTETAPVASATAPASDATATAGAPAADQQQQTIDPDSVLGRIVLAVNGYYSAKTPQDKAKFVLESERMLPLMEKYYDEHPITSRTIKSVEPPSGFALGGLSYWRTKVVLDDGSTGFVAMRIFDKEPKIDWESEVRYCTYDWDKWLADKSKETGDFRVYAVVDKEYKAPFEDNTRFLCLKVKTMDSDKTMNVYLDLTDFDQREFARQLIEAGNNPIECVLTIQQVDSKDGAPVGKVVKVVSPSWVIPYGAV